MDHRSNGTDGDGTMVKHYRTRTGRSAFSSALYQGERSHRAVFPAYVLFLGRSSTLRPDLGRSISIYSIGFTSELFDHGPGMALLGAVEL